MQAVLPFDDVETFEPEPIPLARRTDPATSHEAAAEVSKSLGALQRACLNVLEKANGPVTASEVADEAAHGGDAMRESYRKRLRELVRLGFAVEHEPRQCSVTGKRATTFMAKVIN